MMLGTQEGTGNLNLVSVSKFCAPSLYYTVSIAQNKTQCIIDQKHVKYSFSANYTLLYSHYNLVTHVLCDGNIY